MRNIKAIEEETPRLLPPSFHTEPNVVLIHLLLSLVSVTAVDAGGVSGRDHIA